MHPTYLSTQYALREADDTVRVPVQHHHAHVAACMAGSGLDGSRPVIGVAFDGTGYGTDGAIWGGEFLVADYAAFRRVAHLAYVALPGGDTAIRKPYRQALAHLRAAGVAWDEALAPVRTASPMERGVIAQQIERGLNTFPTSSMGRLFDAVAAIAGVRQRVSYEAQAAIELEMLVDEAESTAYEWQLETTGWSFSQESLQIGAGPIIQSVVGDVKAGVPQGVIAARFHNCVAALVDRLCRFVRAETGLNQVALSGGVWQNVTLLAKTLELLEAGDFDVYTHQVVPPNDGGLALGQAAIANFQRDH
jgi:hydrogenase maturation protein HypF